MLSPWGVFRCFLKGHSLRTDWREVCSLSEGQETVSQWTQSFDDLIKPRAKSVQDYSDVLVLINLFGSHLRFGTNTPLRLRVQNPLATHSEWEHTYHKRQIYHLFFYIIVLRVSHRRSEETCFSVFVTFRHLLRQSTVSTVSGLVQTF